MISQSPLSALIGKPDALRETLAQAKRTSAEIKETPASVPSRDGVSWRPAGVAMNLSPEQMSFAQAVGSPEGHQAAQAFAQKLQQGPFAFVLPSQDAASGGMA